MKYKAFFFDMDGVLVDSMPNHIAAWLETFSHYDVTITPRDIYLNEGRRSTETIRLLTDRENKQFSDEQIGEIYQQKTTAYRANGGARRQIPGVSEVLHLLKDQGAGIWVVTGGAQKDLYEQLVALFGEGIFSRDKMITALDVTHGKPAPEPYLRAWERSGFKKEECCIVENAPLGCQAGQASGIFTAGVISTSALTQDDLLSAGADRVFADMSELKAWLEA